MCWSSAVDTGTAQCEADTLSLDCYRLVSAPWLSLELWHSEADRSIPGRHPTASTHPPWASRTLCFNEINWIPLVCTSSMLGASQGGVPAWGTPTELLTSVLGWGVGGVSMAMPPRTAGETHGKGLCPIQSHHPALLHANPTSPAPRVSVSLNYGSGPPTALTTTAARCNRSKHTSNPCNRGIHVTCESTR